MANEADRNVITLLTNDDWIVNDLETLTRSVALIYDARLATFIWKQRLMIDLEERKKSLKKSIEKVRRHWHGPGPYEWYEAWIEMLETEGVTDVETSLPFGMLRIPASRDVLSPVQILQSIDLFASNSERCRIKQAKMNSPGGFSFTGIGEIIKEFRELLKDIWYRNRQEKEHGEIDLKLKKVDLIEKYLALDSKLAPTQELIVSVSTGVEGLLEMEKSGKLKPVDENIDKRELN